MERMFKIRRTADELYSKGGSEPSWSKRGKVWNGLGALKAHLSLVRERWEGTNQYQARKNQPPVPFVYQDCVIEEMALSVVITVDVGGVDLLKRKK